MKKTKRKRLLLLTLLSSFLLVSCGRNIHSFEYLENKVKNDLKEVYSVSYCATALILDYVKAFYPEQNQLKIHDKSSNALVYGVNDSEVEHLVFIPSYNTSKIYKFALNSEVRYQDIVTHIQNEFPLTTKEQIKARLVDNDVISDLPVILLGFPIQVDEKVYVYYVHENEINSFIY